MDGGGQGGNLKTDACKTNKEKCYDKHKGKRPKVTFEQLLGKYRKISYEKNSCRPTNKKIIVATSKAEIGRPGLTKGEV
jgi:hypothetical protein